MKAAVFGSCMSNLVMARLQSNYGYEQTHSIHHNRSDVFIKYHLGNSPMIPLEKLENILITKDEYSNEAVNILRNQYKKYLGLFQLEHNREKYGNFIEYAVNQSWDFILLDNFMDVAAKLMFDYKEDPDQTMPLFLNPHFYKNENELAARFHHTEFLKPEESAANWLKIYKWLRELQPKSKIFFLPYHSCSSTQHMDRFNRIKNFSNIFREISSNEDIKIIPPLEVSENLTKGQNDWPHFIDKVYDALAGHIYLSIEANIW